MSSFYREQRDDEDDESWWSWSYVGDYGVCASLIAMLATITFLVPPRVRFLYPDNPAFSYPLQSQTVPVWLLFVLSIVVPVVIAAAVLLPLAILNKFGKRRVFMEIHHFLLAMLLVVLLTLIVTQILKVQVGRYRPFYNTDATPDGDARSSFPSGHSSLSFATLTYFSLWLSGKFYVFVTGYTWSYILCFSPMAIATFISISRIVDYWHHPSDVAFGVAIGIFFAVSIYPLFFGSLFSPEDCSRPKNRLTVFKKDI